MDTFSHLPFQGPHQTILIELEFPVPNASYNCSILHAAGHPAATALAVDVYAKSSSFSLSLR